MASLDADGLAAFACVSRHARALASDPRLWHRLLGTELTQSSWSLPDGCVFALEHRDMVRLLSVRVRREPSIPPHDTSFVWLPPRLAKPKLAGIASTAATPASAAAPASATARRAQRLDVSPDGLSVSFVGEHLGGNRAVRCDQPLPRLPFDTLRFVRRGGGVRDGDSDSDVGDSSSADTRGDARSERRIAMRSSEMDGLPCPCPVALPRCEPEPHRRPNPNPNLK